jgi:threonine aldolase
MPLERARDFVERQAPHRPLLFEVGEAGLIRLVCSWDTTEEDVQRVVADLEARQA